MELFRYFDDNEKQKLLTRVNASADVVATTFINRDNGSIEAFRHLDSLAKGYESAMTLINKLGDFPWEKLFQGQDASSELINRLLTMKIGDLVPDGLRSEVDIARLLFKSCLEEEGQAKLRTHIGRIVEARKGIEDLLVSQAENLIQNLLTRTAEETPEIKEYYQQTGLEDLTNCIIVSDARDVAYGGYAAVYETNLVRPHCAPRKVAVKVLRVYQLDNQAKLSRIRRRLRKEIHIWQDLKHVNIIPLLGLTHRFKKAPFPSMVCPWMEGGTLTTFLVSQRESITLEERFKLLMDVIDGLCYLHSKSVIHGDLSSANVLIDSEKRACLSDFGLSKIISEFPGTSYVTSKVAGAARWAAPELFRPTFDIEGNEEPIEITKPCDIYSYGCIVQEVVSGQLPYFNIPSEYYVTIQKMTRIAPLRPLEPLLTDEIWDFIQLCWRDLPGNRPEASQVCGKIKKIYHSYSAQALEATVSGED